MEGTIWAFLPAVIAIVLALLTKQVYVSLFFGIFVGAFMYAGFDPLKAMFTLYQVMSEKGYAFQHAFLLPFDTGWQNLSHLPLASLLCHR